jgi:long-chain acyl-CoA synthetase
MIEGQIPTVSSLLDRHARENPARIALKFEGQDVSYADLRDAVAAAAVALRHFGVGSGDRIAYLGKNHARYFILLFAAARLGVVMVPIGWRLAAAEVAYILDDTQARLLFSDAFCASLADDAAIGKELGLFCLERNEAGMKDWEKFIDTGPGHADQRDDEETIFLQLYTSGTTGRPKGVMLCARNIFAMRIQCALHGIEWDRWDGDDVALIAMPVSHIGGSGFGLMSLYHGATGLVTREFSPEGTLAAIREEGVSKFFIVPTALQILVRHPLAGATDFSRVRHILYGASPMPLPLLKEAIEVVGAGLVQQYGMTETAGTIVALEPEDHDPAGNERMKSAGKALPGVEIRIVGERAEQCASGEVGEILVRSDAIMRGYWNLPDATADAVDEDGWLRTGDAGFLDSEGYLYICDRVKDMVCSGGENVYPAEVEAVLYAYPGVAEAAVIGVPDPKWGEAVKAIVVLKDGIMIDAVSLLEFARSRLAGFKVPKSVDFVTALPRNASGKVLKKELRAPFWEGRDRLVN